MEKWGENEREIKLEDSISKIIEEWKKNKEKINLEDSISKIIEKWEENKKEIKLEYSISKIIEEWKKNKGKIKLDNSISRIIEKWEKSKRKIKIRSSINKIIEEDNKNKKEIKIDDAIVEFFVINPDIEFIINSYDYMNDYDKNKDLIIFAKNYYEKKHNNNLPAQIRLVLYDDESTEFNKYEYLEKSLIYNYDKSTNIYKNINGYEFCEVKQVRDIPDAYKKLTNQFEMSDKNKRLYYSNKTKENNIIKEKKELFEISDMDEKFYNITTKEEKEKIYNLVDDDAVVTIESASKYDYYNNIVNETIDNKNIDDETIENKNIFGKTREHYDKFNLQKAVQLYKCEKKKNVIPKQINIIIYEPLLDDGTIIGKYFRSYIWDENKNDPILKYKLDKHINEDINKLPDYFLNSKTRIKYDIGNKNDNNIIK